MGQRTGRNRSRKGKTKKGAGSSKASSTNIEGWPSQRLSEWPIEPEWTPSNEGKKVGPVAYQKVVGAVAAVFKDDTMSAVLGGLRDYCFQQGDQTNANIRDRLFFDDVLNHDLVFFNGDKGRPIVEDMPLDPKVYDAFPQMKDSYLDVLRVEKRGLLGGVEANSLLHERHVKAGTRLFGGLKAGEFTLCRVVRIGRGFYIDEPWLRLSREGAERIAKEARREYEQTAQGLPGLTVPSFLKVAGYHLYEAAAAHQLVSELRQITAGDFEFAPTIVRFRLRKRRGLPNLDGLPKARLADSEGGRTILVTVALTNDNALPKTLREAMVGIDGKEVFVLSFISGAEDVIAWVRDAVPNTAACTHEELSPTDTYRALRHLVKA